MKNIGGFLTILLFISVWTFRFYHKNGHLPLMEKKEIKNDLGVNPIPSKEGYQKLMKPEVFKTIVENNRRRIVKNPPMIPTHTFRRKEQQQLLLPPCQLSQELNQIIQSCDFTSPIVRTEAITLASTSTGNYNLGQMCDIFDYAKASWKYVNDPIGQEYVAKASETLTNKYIGDCDDFAVVLGSMLMAVGGDIRINYAFGEAGGHAYVEANLGDVNFEPMVGYIKARYQLPTDTKIRVRKDKRTNNLWLNMDWFQNNPGGTYFNYDKGTSYYVVDQKCETFTRLTDMIWYEMDNNKKKLERIPADQLPKKNIYESLVN